MSGGARPFRWWFVVGAAVVVVVAVLSARRESWSVDVAQGLARADGRAVVVFLDRASGAAADSMRAWMRDESSWRDPLLDQLTFVHLRDPEAAALPPEVANVRLGLVVLDHDGEWLALRSGGGDRESTIEFLELVQQRLPAIRGHRSAGDAGALALGVELAALSSEGPAERWLQLGLVNEDREDGDALQRAHARERLARIAIERGRVAQACDHLEALEKEPFVDQIDPAALGLTRALVLCEQGHDGAAADELRRALDAAPDSPEVGRLWFELLRVQRRLGDEEGAERSRRALQSGGHETWLRKATGARDGSR